MGKRGRRTRQDLDGPAQHVPGQMGLVPGDTDFDGQEVVVQAWTDPFGQRSAAILPAAARQLDRDLALHLREIGEIATEVWEKQMHLEHFVVEGRSRGLSWSLIGWATGLTSEGARLKWKDAASRHAAALDDGIGPPVS